MDRRHVLIMKYLINSKEALSSEVLASVLGSTSKTVRNDMELIENILERFGAHIISKSGLGYIIKIFDKNEFNVFLQSFNEKYHNNNMIPNYNIGRIQYIIHRLLLENDYLKSEDLIDELYISRTTLTADLKTVRSIMKKYHIDIEQKSNHGIKITGNERHIRIALGDYLYIDEDITSQEDDDFYIDMDSKYCHDLLVDMLLKNNIHLTVHGVDQLVNQILISYYRQSIGHFVTFSAGQLENIKENEEFSLLKELLETLNFERNDNELASLSLYLISRRQYGLDDDFNLIKHKSLYFLCDELLKVLFMYTNIDFSSDQELRMHLTSYLRGMLIRAEYGLEYHNVSMLKAKQDNSALEYAVIMCDYILKECSYDIFEEELVAIATFLQESLFKDNRRYIKQNICLIFYSGKSSALMTLQELKKHFSSYIEKIDIKESYELTNEAQKKYDLVITDMPVSRFQINIPIFQIIDQLSNNFEIKKLHRLLTQKDKKLQVLLEAFSENLYLRNIEANTLEEVITLMCNKMTEKSNASDNLIEMILHREKISSTDRGNNVAIAHSLYTSGQKSIVSIGILKKPILWNTELVQLVFIVAIGENEDSKFLTLEFLQRMIRNINYVHRLLKSTTFIEAKSIIKQSFLDI